MFGHLSEERLMDVVDGVAAPREREHAAVCTVCRTRVSEAAEAWALAEGAEVPEPPALYWEAFRRQVDHRIQGEKRHRWLPFLVPLAAAAGLAVAFVATGPARTVVAPPSANAVLPPWSPLPAAEDDPGLEVLKAVVAGDSDLVTVYERQGIQEQLWDLTDEESQAVAERLRADAGRLGSL
jgi:hypothetical protein